MMKNYQLKEYLLAAVFILAIVYAAYTYFLGIKNSSSEILSIAALVVIGWVLLLKMK